MLSLVDFPHLPPFLRREKATASLKASEQKKKEAIQAREFNLDAGPSQVDILPQQPLGA